MNNSKQHSKGGFLAMPGCIRMGSTNIRNFQGLSLNTNWRLAMCVLACTVLASGGAWGAIAPARVSDIRNTKHNLSASSSGTVKATTETQVCVFCHTPHAATLGVTPLWNRKLSDTSYTVYTSSSLDADVVQGGLDQPGGSSKLCLSCHDGTLAIGSVNVLNGLGSSSTQGTQSIDMVGTDVSGGMPAGGGTTTGYTRNLGIDLTNDHPISVTYTTALADRDGELRSVDGDQKSVLIPGSPGYAVGTLMGIRSPGYRPKIPLEPTGAGNLGQIQCAACHDPHVRDLNEAAVGNQKFLRLNRFQEDTPPVYYDETKDINCVACHDKNNGAGTWMYSAHANADTSQGANQTYTIAAATQNEFPSSLPVWKASCLNCHDTHTVQGSRWLLRQGTDANGSAIEETCYQCHTTTGESIVENGNPVADIKSDYTQIGGKRMPIKSSEQAAGTEVHEIGGNFDDSAYGGVNADCSYPTGTNKCGADFVEQRAKLGAGNLNNRHAECTDCHNPHRAVKFQSFAPGNLAVQPDATGTHPHTDTAMNHTNIASGALRGTFGVEPAYMSADFNALPDTLGYTVKRGDPGTDTLGVADCADTNKASCDAKPYVTREYQICLKCHSDYGYDDDNNPDGLTTRPALGGSGTTSSAANGYMTHYTNQAREFQAPNNHRGQPSPDPNDSGAGSSYLAGNYRSWHPVMDSTGRTPLVRGSMTAAMFNPPWDNAVGTQTMYCSDCHGSNVTSGSSAIPDTGKSWGPHGSTNDFILKGAFNPTTGTGQSGDICFKCHSYNDYATATSSYKSGFSSASAGINNLHSHHVSKIGRIRCNWCHTAVPHGWKNKALLVNLNDVGPEAECRQEDADDQPTGGKCTVGSLMTTGTQMRNGPVAAGNGAWKTTNYWVDRGYTNPPYYLNALLKIKTFQASGAWTINDCGSAGAPGNGATGCAAGGGWSTTSDESCKTAP